MNEIITIMNYKCDLTSLQRGKLLRSIEFLHIGISAMKHIKQSKLTSLGSPVRLRRVLSWNISSMFSF